MVLLSNDDADLVIDPQTSHVEISTLLGPPFLRFTSVNGDNYSIPMGFSNEVNSRFHEGPVSFAPDGKSMNSTVPAPT